jgi:ribosomal protein S18 acetylase RimI-like enzyme
LEDKGKIVGVLCIQKQTDSLHISRLGVRKGHWRKGYGKELLKFTISEARERGTQKISLERETENVEFYKGLGFKTTREYHDPHWGNSATMELSLPI